MAGRIARERNPCIRSATGVERTQNDIGKGLCLGHGLPQVQARQIAADIDGSARPTNRLRGAAPRGEMRMARRPGEHRTGDAKVIMLPVRTAIHGAGLPSIDITPPVDGKSHPRHRSVGDVAAQTKDPRLHAPCRYGRALGDRDRTWLTQELVLNPDAGALPCRQVTARQSNFGCGGRGRRIASTFLIHLSRCGCCAAQASIAKEIPRSSCCPAGH